MKAAERDGRFDGFDELDLTTLRIDNKYLRSSGSLRGCIVSKPSKRPSDIIRECNSAKLYYDDKRDTEEAIKRIKKHFYSNN
ncbi:hypothetical protein BMS3Abin17_00965 [archaeon BMS3Abin17]|nr:hypothetical protein BMS3Abin17_00965 [archaeon BMS3Abin17]